jgi:hypothetical protein
VVLRFPLSLPLVKLPSPILPMPTVLLFLLVSSPLLLLTPGPPASWKILASKSLGPLFDF